MIPLILVAATVLPFDQALEKAQAEGKPLVVISSASWCGPCQALKRALKTAPKEAEKYVFTIVDGETDPRFAPHTKSFPTTFLYDKSRKLKARIIGYDSMNKFLEQIRQVLR